MAETIAGHSLGSIALPEDNHHKMDECPRCGEVKQSIAELCQACYLRTVAVRRKEIKALARDLIRSHREGETLIFESGPGVDFKQAIKVMVAAIVTKYSS